MSGTAYLAGGVMLEPNEAAFVEFAMARNISFAYDGHSMGTYSLEGSYNATVMAGACAKTIGGGADSFGNELGTAL